MTQEEKPKCDVDDIICHRTALNYLQGLQQVLGTDKFKADFPELEGISAIITEKSKKLESSLQESLAKCKPPTTEEILRVRESPYTRPEEEKANANETST